MGIKACYISGEQDNEYVKESVLKGDYQVVYFTPEMILGSKRWREMLVGEVYSTTFVVDEAHTVKTWYDIILLKIKIYFKFIIFYRGVTFRRLLLRIGEVRSLLPPDANIMALTATATETLRRDVSRIIGMRNELVVSKPPVKSNIMYAVVPFSTLEQTFLSVAERLQKERAKCPPFDCIL